MTNYEHTTRAELIEKVQQKLGEDGTHWPITEIRLSIDEALLTFGALSGFWKEDIFLLSEENKIIYDLFTEVVVGKSYIEPSIKWVTVFDWINKDLMENISFAEPESEFLALDVYSELLANKYDQYQQLTSLVLSQQEFIIPANQRDVELPSNLIDIRRISFIAEDGVEYILDEADEQEIYIYSDDLLKVNIPRFYSTTYGKTKTLKLHPVPANVGKLKLIFVAGVLDDLNIDEDTIINLPNNLIPYLKFGVMADIFSNEGVLNDPVRAAYCKQRWEEGIFIGRNYPSALIARINGGNIIGLDSLNNVDLYSDNVKVRTPPTILGFAGFNIFRTDTIASAVQYNILVVTIANAPLPEDDDSFIEVDIEYIDTLADYVVHLTKFRNGAHEVAMTNNLKDNFLKISINHNRRLIQSGVTFEHLLGITKKQEKEQPRIPAEV